MQLSRPLLILILPLFFARRLLFQRRFFDFLFKAPSFSLSGGFFVVVGVLFLVLMMSFCLFFSLFTLLFFRFGGFHFDNTGERRKKQMRRYNRMERVMRERELKRFQRDDHHHLY